MCFFFFQAEDGIRDLVRSRGLGDVYKRQVQQHTIHGIVLDVMMQTRDEGFHLARVLRKTPQTRNVPILMLTGVNAESARQGHPLRLSDDDRDEMWLPVDRFLDKPVSPERLIAMLRELLGE